MGQGRQSHGGRNPESHGLRAQQVPGRPEEHYLGVSATVWCILSRTSRSWLVAAVLVVAPAYAGDLGKEQVLDMIGAATELRPADLSGKDLSNLDLSHVDFKRAKLRDRKSTRLNSSHVRISYAVFCLKKKKKNRDRPRAMT